MATKPTPGGSDGTYGTELNAFLDISLASDGKVKTEALQSASTAPVADEALANKLYVDNRTVATYAAGGKVKNEILQTAATAPIDDAALANKKYVDDMNAGTGTIQVVNVMDSAYTDCTTSLPYDDTIPQSSEGDEVMTLAVTPTSATNELRIDVVAVVGMPTAGGNEIVVALFQDSTAGALAAAVGTVSGALLAEWSTTVSFTYYMTAATTSSTTFKVRVGADGVHCNFNGSDDTRVLGGVSASSITITEVNV